MSGPVRHAAALELVPASPTEGRGFPAPLGAAWAAWPAAFAAWAAWHAARAVLVAAWALLAGCLTVALVGSVLDAITGGITP